MKLLRKLAPLLAVTFVASCSDDFVSGADSTPEEVVDALVGTWNATSFVFTNKANSSETFDLLADGGSFSITFTATRGFSGSSTFEGATDTFSGTYIVQGTNLITSETGESDETVAFTLSGNTLTLTLDDEFDFNDDDVDEPATLSIVLQRT